MAPKRSANPGRTAKYYRENPEAYKKKLKKAKAYNAKPSNRKYRSKLAIARKKRGIYGKGGDDLSHTKSGRLVLETPKKNRARNGHGKNGRLK
jgi:hypothetical protein